MTNKNKEQLDLYNYQAITGLKSSTYSGYGMKAFNIVSFEASLNINQSYLNNNDILNIEIKAMNTAMESLQKSVNNFKSSMTNFSGMDLDKITPDYTGGEISFSSDNMADYLGETLTVNGIQYTFANDGLGNNIDISAAANAEDVMEALKNKLPANADFTFEEGKFKFPLYTIDGTSSVLNSNGVKTGEPHLMSEDQSKELSQLQQLAFSTMLMMSDYLNTSANGKYLFGGGVSTEAPVKFPFRTLSEFQEYYDGVNIKYPEYANANLSNWSFNGKDAGNLTLERGANGGNTGVIKASGADGFLRTAVVGGSGTTGDLTFNASKNTIKATEYGAFNNLKPGDAMVIGGTDAGANGKAYVIKSVSEDGKTVTLDESTPITADMTIPNGGDAVFSNSYPIGSVIDMEGFGNNISPRVQVTGISDDGKELYVTVDPSRWPEAGSPVTIPSTGEWKMNSASYYEGGHLSSERIVSSNQSITMDVTASDPAFEKLFRALGQVAQGNLVDLRNPAEELGSLISSGSTLSQAESAMDLLLEGLFNAGQTSSKQNADLYTVMAKINSNYVVVDTVIKEQTLIKKNLEDSVSSLKNVDRTDAAAKAIIAAGNLDASYAVINQAMNVSLLNYLK